MISEKDNQNGSEGFNLNFDKYLTYKSGYDALFSREESNAEEMLVLAQDESILNVPIRIMEALEIPFKTELKSKNDLNPKVLCVVEEKIEKKIGGFEKMWECKTKPIVTAKEFH